MHVFVTCDFTFSNWGANMMDEFALLRSSSKLTEFSCKSERHSSLETGSVPLRNIFKKNLNELINA